MSHGFMPNARPGPDLEPGSDLEPGAGPGPRRPARVLAALERIRAAADDILAGGGSLVGELDTAPELLARTDQVITEVADGAVRYAGSVGKLLD